MLIESKKQLSISDMIFRVDGDDYLYDENIILYPESHFILIIIFH